MQDEHDYFASLRNRCQLISLVILVLMNLFCDFRIHAYPFDYAVILDLGDDEHGSLNF